MVIWERLVAAVKSDGDIARELETPSPGVEAVAELQGSTIFLEASTSRPSG